MNAGENLEYVCEPSTQWGVTKASALREPGVCAYI